MWPLPCREATEPASSWMLPVKRLRKLSLISVCSSLPMMTSNAFEQALQNNPVRSNKCLEKLLQMAVSLELSAPAKLNENHDLVRSIVVRTLSTSTSRKRRPRPKSRKLPQCSSSASKIRTLSSVITHCRAALSCGQTWYPKSAAQLSRPAPHHYLGAHGGM